MPRRQKQKSATALVIQLAACWIAGFVFLPSLRLLLIAGGSLGVVVILLVWRCVAKRPQPRPSVQHGNPFPSPPQSHSQSVACAVAVQTPNDEKSDDVRFLDWFQFEKLIAALYEQEGFKVHRSGGANPDGGIDVIVEKNETVIGVQCKHWKNCRVTVKEVRAFSGALHDRQIAKGVLVTVKGYTKDAVQFAQRNNIELLDEPELLKRLAGVNWRTNPALAELLNDKRKMCPKCESPMLLRHATKGRSVGTKFWGCSTFPRCKFIMNEATC